ncbi:unnamed protein product [Anisakis simplex]|uniref:ZP domain-containing protein n=1 Tax=Anisakis simplex TaxID=6269 RepID=A0A0M3JGK2_ANISI|nr:unnamed protein product [Anisakis simplex]
MEIVDGDEQAALNKVVVYGMPYSLRIVMNTSDAPQHFRVVNCRAHDATHKATVQLTNWNGCSLNYNLFSDFVYEENHATAQLPTMFRFPMNDVVQFECVMIICQDQADCNVSHFRNHFSLPAVILLLTDPATLGYRCPYG